MASLMESNVENILLNLRQFQWDYVRKGLESLTESLRDEESRKCVTQETLQCLSNMLTACHQNWGNAVAFSCLTECFRTLRNACAGSSANQTAVVQSTSAVQATVSILSELTADSDNLILDQVMCLRCGLQFLGNIIVNHAENQLIVWGVGHRLLSNALLSRDEKVGSYASMVVFNILQGSPEVRRNLHENEAVWSIFRPLLNLGLDSEFALFAVELLVCETGYVEKAYPILDPKFRLILLDMLQTWLPKLPVSVVVFLKEELMNSADCILDTCEKAVENVQPEVVSKLLDLICGATNEERHRETLQQDKSLLVTGVYLLRSIHFLGKSGDNNFSAVEKLSQLSLQEKKEEVEVHPAYGFKRSVIRLLGNLVYRNTANQDQLRELEGIPLILDCCGMDARNPFIIQWVVMAVRNLCEGNEANQQVIAALRQSGEVKTSVLHELGITVQQRGDKFMVVPADNSQPHS